MDDSAIGRLIHALAKVFAIAGGLVLIAVVVIVVCSVIGRTLMWAGLRPIAGDYEIVEAGVFFAIFAFMPWCHLMRGHAVVGVVTDRLSPRVNVVIELFMDVLMLAVATFVAWRHWHGMLDKFGNQEITFILHIPLWWSYAGGMIGAIAFVIVAVYCRCPLRRQTRYRPTLKAQFGTSRMSNVELGLWSFPGPAAADLPAHAHRACHADRRRRRQLPHHQILEPEPRAVQVADLFDLLQLLASPSCRCSC